MQVEQTKSEGLTREFAITISADDIESKVGARLDEISKTVKMPGFRPGKVPVTLLRKQYGPQVIGEVLERAISETSAETLRENDLRPAMQPKVRIDSFDEGQDLKYTMTVELMPEIAPIDFSKVKLDRLAVEVTDDMVTEALERIAAEQKVFEPIAEDRPAGESDAVLVDFTGRIDGEEFPGGSAKDFELQLDSQSFIPGFVEQVRGMKKGEKRTIKVTFPEEYGAETLAGKPAEFDIEVKEVRARKPVELNDDLAKAAGLESLDAMKGAVAERLNSEYGQIARMRLKRTLLDKLAELADFDVPPAMIEGEFAQIWSNITGVPVHDHDHDHDHEHGEEGHEHDHGPRPDPAAQERFKQFLEESGKSEDELKAEYRAIAERRVRLGILLSETGRSNNIQVSDEELNRAIANEARRFPGQERQVIEYYQKDRAALEQLRAPLFEDKVVDFILELADVSEKKVSADELMRDPDEQAEADESTEGSTEKKASGAKKPARKTSAKAAEAGPEETEDKA